MIFNKRKRWSHKRWFHSSRVKLLLVHMSASGFRCRHIWFGSWCPGWFCRITNQQQLCGLLTRVSSLDFCSERSFWSLLQRCTTETRLDKNLRLWWRCPHATIDQHLVFPSGWVWMCGSANSFLLLVWLVFWHRSMNVTFLSPHPINQEPIIHLFAIQHPTKRFLTLQNCGILTFVSCTPSWWGRMFDFRRYIRCSPKLIFDPSKSPAKSDPIDNAEPCYPHDNTVGSQLCDECLKSNELSVCHKLLFIVWLFEQVWLLTKECRVYQFVPSTSNSRQCVSTILTILQLIQDHLSLNGDDPSKDLRLCVTVLPLCSPILSISQCISEHVLSRRKTTLFFFAWSFSTLEIFIYSSRKSTFEHFSVLLDNNFVRLTFAFSASQIYVIKKWIWFIKINSLHQCSKMDLLFVSLCFQNDLLLALNFAQLLPFLVHCNLNDLAWMLAAFLSVSPRTTYIRLEVFLPIE